MKNVVGTFHKIQKAYYQYCYQAVEPDGIKMSEMACILSLYNSAPKDTARDIIEYSCLSPGMVSRSLESLRKSGLIEGYRDQADISICVCCRERPRFWTSSHRLKPNSLLVLRKAFQKRILRRSAKLQRRWLKIWMRIRNSKSPSLKNKRSAWRVTPCTPLICIKQNQKQISWHLNIRRQRRFHNASVVQRIY